MNRVASAIIVLAGSLQLSIGVLGMTFSNTTFGMPVMVLALCGLFMMLAGLIGMCFRDRSP